MRCFKLSQDPAFAAKLRDVVGLYLDPPAHSLVLSVDEKSQIQALDRTQPGLPIKKGRAGTMTHDYKEAHGEFESECPGYCGAQDTFYVGTLTGVGRIYQQTVIDTYAKGCLRQAL